MAISLPPDGLGKPVETNTPDGTNHRQVMTVGDKTTAANTLAIDSSGRATVLVATNPVLVRETDGTNPITKTFDADTSGVTHEYVAGVSLRKGASGGSVEAFTSTNPGRIDPTGTTVQPVSGTVTANQGGTWNVGTLSTVTNVVHVDDNASSLTVDGTVTANAGTGTFAVSAASLPLPTGASTAAKQPALGTAGTASSDVITVQGIASMTPLQIADNGGSLTVDNGGTFAVQAAQSGNWAVRTQDGAGNAINSTSNALNVYIAGGGAGDGAILDGVSSAIKATVLDYTNSNPIAVRLSDTNGDYVAAGAGTQYTEDAAAAADPIGGMLIARRRDTPAAETTTDGDNTALNCTSKGELYVKHIDAVPVTGTFYQATQPVSIAAAVAVTDNSGSLTVDNGGTFAVQAAQSGTWTVQPGNTANTTPWLVSQVPGTSGGCTIKHLVAAASTNPTVIKNSPGQVFGWNIYNAAQHPIYVKFHNQTTSPTAGTGVVHAIGVQAGTAREYWNGAGIAFGTGIAMTIVTGIADADNTAVAASDCVVDIYYV